MNRRGLFASILLTFLLVLSLGGVTPAANAVPAGQSLLKAGQSAKNSMTEVRYRRRGPVMYLPIGPSYLYYDYPYYYSRGYYPTHIGPHYIYYGPSGYYDRSYSRSSSGRCSYWHRRCTANWGGGSDDYDGCMQYHRCQ